MQYYTNIIHTDLVIERSLRLKLEGKRPIETMEDLAGHIDEYRVIPQCITISEMAFNCETFEIRPLVSK